MAERIGCRNCGSPDCKGCNIHTLATMLNNGKFDCLMNGNRSVNPFADVVEVVRCKDCKWGDTIGSYGCYCQNIKTPWFNDEFQIYTDKDDFCSYGERRNDATD